MNLNSIEQATILRKLQQNQHRISRLRSMLQGEPIKGIRFADAAIVDAKIDSLSASKIAAGDLVSLINVGSSESGEIRLDAPNVRISMIDVDEDNRVIIGLVDGVFTVRISLPGIDALASNDPRDFSLFADQDNVLIKEYVRGNVEVTGYSTLEIEHGLGYVPLVFVYAEDIYYDQYLHGPGLYSSFYWLADEENIYLHNSTVTRNFKYYIFYDNVV